jgi:hypothetical protein
MALDNNAKNAMLDHLAGIAVYVSAHSASGSTTGANELAGGAPAYARKSITWNSASGGALDSSNAPVFDIESGDTVAFVGLFSAVTSGTWYGEADVTDEVFGAQGTYTVDDFDITLT